MTDLSRLPVFTRLYANGSDATTGKAFCLFCAADQEAGIEVVSQTLKYNLGNISEAVASAVGGSVRLRSVLFPLVFVRCVTDPNELLLADVWLWLCLRLHDGLSF